MRTALVIAAAASPFLVPFLKAGVKRAVSPASAGPGELRYSRGLRRLVVLLAVVPVVAILAMMPLRPHHRPDEWWGLPVLILLFPAVASPFVLAAFRVRHRVDEVGISFHSPWARDRYLAWAEVSTLKWRQSMRWLELRAASGAVVRISPWLAGLARFADVAMAGIPPAVLERCPEEHVLLRIMAAGGSAELATSPLPPDKVLEKVLRRRASGG